jgi:hypothetical protein
MKAANRDDKGGGKKWNYKDKRQQRLGGKNGGLSLSLSQLSPKPNSCLLASIPL